MADVVEVYAVEGGVAGHQLSEGCSQPFLDPRSARVQVDPRSSHAVPGGIRKREVGSGIVENRPAAPIDQDHFVPQVLHDFCVSIACQGQNIHPGVDP